MLYNNLNLISTS